MWSLFEEIRTLHYLNQWHWYSIKAGQRHKFSVMAQADLYKFMPGHTVWIDVEG